MTLEEIGTHIIYIKEGVDELKLDKHRQWKRLDEHSISITTLQAKATHAEKAAEASTSSAKKSGLKFGAYGTIMFNALAELIKKLF